jgi:hypothetical protein
MKKHGTAEIATPDSPYPGDITENPKYALRGTAD